MSHFAKINEDNIVEDIIVIPETESSRGQEYINEDLNMPGVWLETSYTGSIRKNYAGIGMVYSQEYDAFIHVQCHEAATLDVETCKWICDDASHNYNLVKEEE